MNKKILALVPILFLFLYGGAAAGEFSLYGGKMGTTRAELDQIWIPLESGEYAIKDAPIYGVIPEFNHNDLLYKLTFSVPVPKEYPSQYATTALQKIIQELWADDKTISLNTRSGRGAVEVTVISKDLEEELVKHIMVRLSTMFRP